MDAQECDVFDNTVYEDHKSAIFLETNGNASSSKRTNHINVRYYFVTGCIGEYELPLEWCPTSYMIGDFMTKPTCGAAFKILKYLLMRVTEAQDPGSGNPKKDW